MAVTSRVERFRTWVSSYLDPLAIKVFGYDFFIAYGSDLTDYAARLQSDLERGTPRMLVCRDTTAPTFGAGGNLTDTVIANMRRCHTVLLIDSLQARRSTFVGDEIKLALGDPVRDGEPPPLPRGRVLIRIARKGHPPSKAPWPLNQDQDRTTAPMPWTGGLSEDQIARLDRKMWIREEPHPKAARIERPEIEEIENVPPIDVPHASPGIVGQVVTNARWLSALRRAMLAAAAALAVAIVLVALAFAPSALDSYLRDAGRDVEACLGTAVCLEQTLTAARGRAESRLARATWLSGWWRVHTFDDAARHVSDVLARAREIPVVDAGVTTNVPGEARWFTRLRDASPEVLSVGRDSVRGGAPGGSLTARCTVPIGAAVTVDPSWSWLLALEQNGQPALWDIVGCERRRLPPGIPGVAAAAFGPDGRLAIDSGRTLHLIDLRRGATSDLPLEESAVQRLLAWNGKGDRLAVADGNVVRMFDTVAATPFSRSAPLAAPVDALQFLFDDDLAALAGGKVSIFTTKDTFDAPMPRAVSEHDTGFQRQFDGMTFWPWGERGTLVAGVSLRDGIVTLISFDYRPRNASRLAPLAQRVETTAVLELHSGIHGWIPYRQGESVGFLRIRERE